ncbi:hypothetical protein FA15DRAFT_651682 [Coprinopsis marcescibilis]|uniref:Signal recognition particle receptor subunit beta n=1 Tax=Coprinopsis marcescibilis TaxID=230819 RepID=A0A5C3LBN0_COPMA|nr:hypothetical protein FA15DRAFT_651682 [Coprinopsis marcescibilis]
MADEIPQATPEVLPISTSFAIPAPVVNWVIAFVAALAIFLVVQLFWKQKRSKGDSLLLVGPSDSGKTALFSKLVYGKSTPTNTSLQTNVSYANPTVTKPLRIIDVPGHPRIRGQLTEYLPQAKTVAFVVDSNTISRTGVAAAEHLHQIIHAITSLPPSQTAPSIVILCNKADLLKTSASSGSAESLAVIRVKTVLERELEKRRSAQSGGVNVEGLGEEGERMELGGLECGDGNAPFRFEDWEGGEITFLGTSVRPGSSEEKAELDEKSEGTGGLSGLLEWLEENF